MTRKNILKIICFLLLVWVTGCHTSAPQSDMPTSELNTEIFSPVCELEYGGSIDKACSEIQKAFSQKKIHLLEGEAETAGMYEIYKDLDENEKYDVGYFFGVQIPTNVIYKNEQKGRLFISVTDLDNGKTKIEVFTITVIDITVKAQETKADTPNLLPHNFVGKYLSILKEIPNMELLTHINAYMPNVKLPLLLEKQ